MPFPVHMTGGCQWRSVHQGTTPVCLLMLVMTMMMTALKGSHTQLAAQAGRACPPPHLVLLPPGLLR
jgi:hypothetical protein